MLAHAGALHRLREGATGAEFSEPLLWCMHGGPGVGKSKVLLLIRELFTDVCGWEMGLQYQMAALQAVMAEQLGGDTLHHALGTNPFGDNRGADSAHQSPSAVAQHVLQWRWLIIDEVSMISANFLAQIDMKLRDLVRDLGTKKHGLDGDRPFGGINVIFSGDFWQLDPPDGAFLGAIPVEYMKRSRRYAAAPDVAHGQSIFWHRGPGCVQGVTELTECVRTDDP